MLTPFNCSKKPWPLSYNHVISALSLIHVLQYFGLQYDPFKINRMVNLYITDGKKIRNHLKLLLAALRPKVLGYNFGGPYSKSSSTPPKNVVVFVIFIVVIVVVVLLFQIYYHAKSGGPSFKIDWNTLISPL